MSWLARSIANSLKLDDDDDNNQNDVARHDTSPPPTKHESDQHSSPSSSSPTTPRGVKEDLSDLTKTLTRQFWGVASFLAPPPEPPSSSSPPRQISDASQPSDPDALIEGIRSHFAEIGGRFKSGISKLSSNKAMSEITKIASNFLQFGSDADVADVDFIGNVIGVTEEVVAFARDIAMHPETWLDFPVPDNDEFEEFDMSDAQQEHALAVERLAPRLTALRMELCPGYMSEGCFWKIYFVLLHPRLNKHDMELLSTPEIVEVRSMLSSQNRAKPQTELKEPDFPQSVSAPLEIQSVEAVPLAVVDKSEVEMEKHPVQSSETQVVDKAMVEEQLVKQTKHQPSTSSSSSSPKFVEDKFEDDGDDWLKEEGSEMVGTSRNSMPIGNDEDVSFSDLEDDDDGDVPTSYKKVTSGSDSSAKDSRDWVQLSRSSSDSVKDISTVSSKHDGSEQVSARNSETKDSNDWLNVDDIDAM